MKRSLEVYKNKWLIDRIYFTSDKIRGKVVDQTLFEERCINRVGEYLLKDVNNIKNFNYIMRMINEVACSVINRNKNEHAEYFSSLTKYDDGGGEIEFEPDDDLTDVESEVIEKDMVALLAQNDHKKLKVLEGWQIGNTNDKQISRTLARTFGGKSESHRKFIQRFRDSCRNKLNTAI